MIDKDQMKAEMHKAIDNRFEKMYGALERSLMEIDTAGMELLRDAENKVNCNSKLSDLEIYTEFGMENRDLQYDFFVMRQEILNRYNYYMDEYRKIQKKEG
jgi:hypothetical protein